MDTEAVDADDFARCLADLATVNRVTLAHRPTLAFLARATRHLPRGSAPRKPPTASSGCTAGVIRNQAARATQPELSVPLLRFDSVPAIRWVTP